MKFSKSGDEWVILDDAKKIVFRHADREVALAEFKRVGTKPRPTGCPHANRTPRESRVTEDITAKPIIDMDQWTQGRMFITSPRGESVHEGAPGNWITWPQRLILVDNPRWHDPSKEWLTVEIGAWCRDCGEKL